MDWLNSFPSFDDVVTALIGTLFGAGSVMYLLTKAAFAIASWIGPVRATRKLWTKFVPVLTRPSTATPARPGAVFASMVSTVLVQIAQLMSLGVAYLGGNFVSAIVNDERRMSLASALEGHEYDWNHPWESLTPAGFGAVSEGIVSRLQLDSVSGAYMIVVALLIIVSYLSKPESDASFGLAIGLGVVAALPAVLIGVILCLEGIILLFLFIFALALGLLSMLFVGDSSDLFSVGFALVPVLLGILACLGYILVFQIAMNGSSAVRSSWVRSFGSN